MLLCKSVFILAFLIVELLYTGGFLARAIDFKSCKIFNLVANTSLNIDGCESVNCDTILVNNSNLETFDESLAKIFQENVLLKTVLINTAVIRQVPAEICRLKQLTRLELRQNCLERLPIDCFNRLSNVEEIVIQGNRIEVLSGNLFEGLNKLKSLYLNGNSIATIEDNVFGNLSDLLNLTKINLNMNQLTSVGPWPLMRGIITSGLLVDLRWNKISRFTNNINWTFNRRLIKNYSLKFEMRLHGNRIQHLSDFINLFFGNLSNVVRAFGKSFSSGVTLTFGENPYVCDCLDYCVNRLLRVFTRVGIMNDARCEEPLNLRKERLLSVSLDDMICDVSNTPLCVEGCRCIKQPSRGLFIVNCSSSPTVLHRLPDSLPPPNIVTPTKAEYDLVFTGNKITTLEPRDYFRLTKVLDLSNVGMENVPEEALTSISKVENIYLHSNLLQTLPKAITNISFDAKLISLHGNLWRCACGDAWFKDWLIKMRPKLENANSISCSSPSWLEGRIVSTVASSEFCENPNAKQRNQVLLGSCSAAAAVLFLTVVAIVLIRKFKVEIHTYINIHPFDKDECTGEHMLYDAFFSCSFSDRLFGIAQIRELESKGYRICYHERDFVGGQSIAYNICQALEQSKRTICYLTPSFLESAYCMFEFRTALHQNIQTKRQRLIVLADDSLVISKQMLPKDVYEFLSTHTYIELKMNKKFINQLLYSLTVTKLGTERN